MKVQVNGNNLVITIPLIAPQASASGKTNVVAKTGGFVNTGVTVEGRPVSLNVTATIPR